MKGKAKCYDELREYLESVPLVDCHDHTGVNCCFWRRITRM